MVVIIFIVCQYHGQCPMPPPIAILLTFYLPMNVIKLSDLAFDVMLHGLAAIFSIYCTLCMYVYIGITLTSLTVNRMLFIHVCNRPTCTRH